MVLFLGVLFKLRGIETVIFKELGIELAYAGASESAFVVTQWFTL